MRILTNTDFRAYGGRYVIEYLLRAGNGGAEVSLGHATWADWDQRGRLILARDGRLLHWESPGSIHLIADFNDDSAQPDSTHRFDLRASAQFCAAVGAAPSIAVRHNHCGAVPATGDFRA